MSFDLRELNTETAPLQVKYSQITPLALSASSKRVSFFPSNAGTFGPNSVIRIPISSSTCFLDGTLSCLKFTYKNKSADGAQIDNSAHSFIQSIRVISRSGGVDLENIRYYNKLVAMLSDLQLNDTDRAAPYHEGYGAGNRANVPLLVSVVAVADTAAAVKVKLDLMLAEINKTSKSDYMGTNEPIIATTESMDFYLPLLSAVLGTAQSKYLPLYLCGQIDLEIQLANFPTISVTNDSAPSFEISNVSFDTQLIEFAGDMNNTLMHLCKQTGLYIHSTSWYCDKIAVLAGSSISVLVSERLKSVKSLFCYTSLPRTNGLQREHARTASICKSFQLKCGSTFFPNQPVLSTDSKASNNGSFITETYKALGLYADTHGKSLMNAGNFESDGHTFNSVGRAIFGCDLDAFVSKHSAIESGFDFVNNNPTNINMVGTFVNSDFYIHILHDILIKIDSNFTLTASR